MKALLLSLLLLTGCTTAHFVVYHPPEIIHCPNEATAFYRAQQDWFGENGNMIRCSGRSMPLPCGYGVTHLAPINSDLDGFVVVYDDGHGSTAHEVIGISYKGMMLKGINNAWPDGRLVSPSRYKGVLVRIYTW